MTVIIEEEYRPNVFAWAIHKVPHVNITLHRVNDTFAPYSSTYIESLGIIGSVPGVWLILTLLVLLIYLLSKCCDRNKKPTKKITGVKVSIVLFSLICSAAIGLGLYGNDDFHNCMMTTMTNGEQVANVIDTVKNQSDILESSLGAGAAAPLSRLADALDAPAANQTALGSLLRSLAALRHNASAACAAARRIRAPVQHVYLSSFIQKLWRYEKYRWWGGMWWWGASGAICVIACGAAARRSRGALLVVSVFSLLGAVCAGLAASGLAPILLASADLCHSKSSPSAAVADIAPRLEPTLTSDVVRYYIECAPHEASLSSEVRVAERAVLAVRQALAALHKGAPVLFNDPGLGPALGALSASTVTAEQAVSRISTILHCRDTQRAFIKTVKPFCNDAIVGISAMLLSTLLCCILFTILVVLNSHAWIYISNNPNFTTTEEQAPFLTGNGTATPVTASINTTNTTQRSGTLRGQGSYLNGKPPSYSAAVALARMDVDDEPRIVPRGAGCHTLGRLPSQPRPPSSTGNGNKYATLSKQCKTLESNDFY